MNISTQLNVRICLIVVVRTVQSFNFVDGVNLMINFLDLESVQKVLYKGPKKNKNGHCKNNRNKVNWSLLPSSCSACNCNGHVEGIQGSIYRNKNAQEQIWKCSSCLHNTSGDQCQCCLSQHQGSPINERKCFPCKCIQPLIVTQMGSVRDFVLEKVELGSFVMNVTSTILPSFTECALTNQKPTSNTYRMKLIITTLIYRYLAFSNF